MIKLGPETTFLLYRYWYYQYYYYYCHHFHLLRVRLAENSSFFIHCEIPQEKKCQRLLPFFSELEI